MPSFFSPVSEAEICKKLLINEHSKDCKELYEELLKNPDQDIIREFSSNQIRNHFMQRLHGAYIEEVNEMKNTMDFTGIASREAGSKGDRRIRFFKAGFMHLRGVLESINKDGQLEKISNGRVFELKS